MYKQARAVDVEPKSAPLIVRKSAFTVSALLAGILPLLLNAAHP